MLLGALHTRFVILQTAFKKAFKDLEPLQVLENYSTPKLRAMLQILRRFDLTHPIEPIRPRRAIVADDEDEEVEDESESVQPPKVTAPVKYSRDRRKKNFRWDPSKKGRNSKNKKVLEDSSISEISEHDAIKSVDEETLANNETTSVKDKPLSVIAALEDTNIENVNGIKDETELVEKENEKSTTVGEEDKDQDPVGDKADALKTRKPRRFPRRGRMANNRSNEPPLCGIVFVENRFDARIL